MNLRRSRAAVVAGRFGERLRIMEQLKPQEAFWVRTVCLVIVIGLPTITLFVLPALKIAPEPGFWPRAAFGLA